MFREACILTLVSATGVAAAGTIDLTYTGIVDGGSAERARIDGSNYRAGHMTHVINSGDRAGESFNTFCIEIGEYANGGSSTYEIVDLADAPNPGTNYGQAKADAVNAVVANAVAMGWIDNRLQAVSSDAAENRARMGAIQAAIWEALGHSFNESHGGTTAGLSARYAELTSESTFDGTLRLEGPRAVVSTGEQDMLYVVSLPPAALAGLGLLGGIAGVRAVRRH